ncbi:MAG: hypothetical protein JRJ54_09410 [Deltaproteobacteria bacterium]|nr:hypothetical protein [Deltaproteobacteria bacterium]
MSSQPIVTINNLSVRRGGQPVLKGIDLQIKTGEQWAPVGPDGSGRPRFHGLFLKNGTATVAPIPFMERIPVGK